jgi:hypothetical protein
MGQSVTPTEYSSLGARGQLERRPVSAPTVPSTRPGFGGT